MILPYGVGVFFTAISREVQQPSAFYIHLVYSLNPI